ncbi:hypothetical protein DW073_14930 [Ruminococcus sp. AF45-4BH]|nr:hypothetical protein DW073_14930 [Ruminococcus sp. AF45-4BH]
MRKRRIGTAKFFTLLLLLYHTSAKVHGLSYFSRKGGNCALFLPSGEDGFGQSPNLGQGTSPLRVLRAAP